MSDAELHEAYAWPTPVDSSRPWVRANMATSVDGSISGNGGQSDSISSPADKQVFRLLRATSQVILVGSGTAKAEGYGPAKTSADPQPAIALVTGRANLDTSSPLFADATTRTIVITSEAAPTDKRAAIAEVADLIVCGSTGVDLPGALRELASRGIQRVLCEGGPHLLGDLVAAGCLDDLCLTTSPLLVGGQATDAKGNEHDPGRILAGPTGLPNGTKLALASLIEADGSLMARWAVSR